MYFRFITYFYEMPIIKSAYRPPIIFRNYHISTIYASVFRKVPPVKQERERMELEDGDFLDLDWSYSKSGKSDKMLIVLHGLEGNAQRPYILGTAHNFNIHGWDVAAVNFRGCSGEINRLYNSYNAGASKDLEQIIQYILSKEKYTSISLKGFSLGGNLMLKYLGEGNVLPKEIKAAVAISTPCDLYGSLKKLEEPQNRIYSKRFVKKLKQQLNQRKNHFPAQLQKEQISTCKSLFDIDELYTSRAHGFENALDYYAKSSSLKFLPKIETPTLMINAKNDGFLSESSYPAKVAETNPNFYLEMPEYGGHVGFLQKKTYSYSEERSLEFLSSYQ
jgi:predicted alpha/beta-fold hydrolase